MRRALLIVAVAVVALLVAAQLVLPGVAERRVRSDLEQDGSQVHVDIAAFPAVKLLWGRADSVKIDVADYASGDDGSDTSLGDLLARTRATGKLDVHVRELADSLLRMQDVRLRKDGDALTAVVRLRRRDIDAALPAHLRLTGSSDDNGISVAGVTSAFGTEIEAEGRIEADDDGSLVLSPADIPLASLASVTLFSDRRVAVDAISARPTADGVAVTARGHLR
jgi:hypothetical protein